MKVGIVIHTNTGHTLTFAQEIRSVLEEKGHEVDIFGLRTIGSVSPAFVPGGNRFSIKNPPELDEHDVVLFGGPVWAFKPSPVIMRYLIEDVKHLKGKRALSFVTFWGLGGKRALLKMNEELEASGADVLKGEALTWFFKPKADVLKAAVLRVCERIGAFA